MLPRSRIEKVVGEFVGCLLQEEGLLHMVNKKDMEVTSFFSELLLWIHKTYNGE